MFKKRVVWILIIFLLVISGCTKKSTLSGYGDKVIPEETPAKEDSIQLNLEDKNLLQEKQTYLYSNGVLYRTESVPSANKMYVYQNESIRISTQIPQENEVYTYINGTLVSSKYTKDKIGYIYINESEFYKNKHRSYTMGLPGGSFTPEPLQGEALNSYFKSLNLTEEYIYVMMQFETPGGDPTKEQIQILASDNITLFEAHGDHTYYAKIPKTILETKSYDFVRWIGIVEDPILKLHSSLEELWGENCIGRINLSIEFYENLNDVQFEKIKEISNGCLIGYKLNCDSVSSDDHIIMEIDISKLKEVTSLNFIKKIGIASTSTGLPGGPGDWITHEDNPFANINCTD